MERDQFYRETDEGSCIKEFASIRGNLTEKEIDRNLCNNNLCENKNIEFNKLKQNDAFQSSGKDISYMLNDESPDNFLSSVVIDKSTFSDDEFDLNKIKSEFFNPTLTMEFNCDEAFKKENSLDLSYQYNPYEDSESDKDPVSISVAEHPQILFQVEVFTDKSLNSYEEPNDIKLSQKSESTNLDTEKADLSSIMNDHNYISQELCPKLSPKTNIQTDEDLKNYVNILCDFKKNLSSNSDQLDTPILLEFIKQLIENAKSLKDVIETKINIEKPNCSDRIIELAISSPSQNIKPDLMEETSTSETDEKPNSVHTENLSLVFQSKRSEPLEFNSIENLPILADKEPKEEENNINTNESESLNEEESQIYLDNRSEPLEYNSNDDISISDMNENEHCKNESNLELEELNKLREIQKFASQLEKNCESFISNPTSTFSQFMEKISADFKQTLNIHPQMDVSVQTEYIKKSLSFEKRKKINDKEKRRLLDFSTTENELSSSEDSSDDELQRIDHSDSNSIVSSNNFLLDAQLNDNSSECSDSDGLDLTKYIDQKDRSKSENDLNKTNDADFKSDTSEKDINENVKEKTTNELTKSIANSENSYNSSTNHMNHENNEDYIMDTDDDLKNSGHSEENKLKLEDSDDELNDEKLKIQPVVLVEKLFEEKLRLSDDEICDKEIDKLVNLNNLMKRKISSNQHIAQDRLPIVKNTKTKNLLEILNDEAKDLYSEESNSETEENVITEQEFLKRFNNNMKLQLLNSSDSENQSEESDEEQLDQKISTDSSISNDSYDYPVVDKFLQDFSIQTDNNDEEMSIKDDDVVDPHTPSPENHVSVEKNNETILETEEMIKTNNELSEFIKINSISGTDKKEIQPSNEHKDENVGESIETDIKLEETKTDKDNEEKKEKNDPSENSDCEILDDLMAIRKPIKHKSLEVLMAEAAKRRKSKSTDDLISLSSDSETDIEEAIAEEKRTIKPMLRQDQLAGETRIAQRQENERIKRLEKKQQLMKDVLKKAEVSIGDLILDYNSEKKSFIKVHADIVKHLKEHQIQGVKFMYDTCYGSVDNLKKHPGSGCILAHCMGLGKTLQLIALLHTLITYKELQTSKILVLCPKSTVMNWMDEIQRWIGPLKSVNLKVFNFPDSSDVHDKVNILTEWFSSGKVGFRRAGCLLIGYEAFRSLVSYHLNKKHKANLTQFQLDRIKKIVAETLLNPGADLVICDEGHIIKNRKSAISSAVSEIKTPRRIILTGTPIQNNLKEYYSMVNFIKPIFLGTEREFANLYANPIKNGQHKDSSKRDIKIMKQRSFVLHKKLSKFVQRREAALLKTFLPEKYEYVLFIPMTDVQNRLYEYFLQSISQREGSKGKSLIPDYTCLRKIWTHPKVLENAWQNAIVAAQKKKDIKKIVPQIIHTDDEDPDDVYDTLDTGVLAVTNDWWRPLITQNDLESILPSNKLRVMFEILRGAQELGEKCLIFSAFVAVLNVVEYFMQQINNRTTNLHEAADNIGLSNFKGPWVTGKDYYRLDGRTSKSIRHEMVTQFNDPNNQRARCFLISAKAGGQGINLIGANRVIILDTSWNPSNDQQNIFRIFRLGQKRKCYIYRLIALGSMEEKVYSRSVTKQAMSFRVVDEQQIDRHFSMAELTELYILTKPDYAERPVPALPQDSILANILRNHPQMLYKYHEHDSLLENRMEQELSELEKADAWDAYERDIQYSQNTQDMLAIADGFNMFAPHDASNYMMPPLNFGANSYPMGYGIGSGIASSLLPSLNYSHSSAIMDMYNMYQNFSANSIPTLPRLGQTRPLNVQQQSYAQNMLPSTSNPLQLGNLPPFSSLNGMPQSTNMTANSYTSPLFSSVNAPNYNTPKSNIEAFSSESLRRLLQDPLTTMNHNINSSSIHSPSTSQGINNHNHQFNMTTNVPIMPPSTNKSSTESIPTSVIRKSDVPINKSNQRSSPTAHVIMRNQPGIRNTGPVNMSTSNTQLQSTNKSNPIILANSPIHSKSPITTHSPASRTGPAIRNDPSPKNSTILKNSPLPGTSQLNKKNSSENMAGNQANLVRGMNMGIIYPETGLIKNTSDTTSMENLMALSQNANISVRPVNSITTTRVPPNNNNKSSPIRMQITSNPSTQKDKNIAKLIPIGTEVNHAQIMGKNNISMNKISSKQPNMKRSTVAQPSSNLILSKPLATIAKSSPQISTFQKKQPINITQPAVKESHGVSITKGGANTSQMSPASALSMISNNKSILNKTQNYVPYTSSNTIVKSAANKSANSVQVNKNNYEKQLSNNSGVLICPPTNNSIVTANKSKQLPTTYINQKNINTGNATINYNSVPNRANKNVLTNAQFGKQSPPTISVLNKPSILKATGKSMNKTNHNNKLFKDRNQLNVGNNAALNSLSGRNSLSIRPIETVNKLGNNTGVTIPTDKNVTNANITNHKTIQPAYSTTKPSETVQSRKRPGSNITLMFPENSPISVREVKKPRLQSKLSESLMRIQSSQGLTVVPRNLSQINQRNEGKTTEVVEID